MSTRIAPMRAEQYPLFLEQAVAGYAADNVAAGRWPAADGPALARAETLRLLPQGPDTPDNHFFEIHGDEATEPVGYLWFGILARGSSRVAYVYQVVVLAAHRRHGHARAGLLALERVVVEMGLSGLALQVFEHNAAAKALYASLGFQVTSLVMAKAI